MIGMCTRVERFAPHKCQFCCKVKSWVHSLLPLE